MIKIFKLSPFLFMILFFAACGGHPVTKSDQRNCPLENKTMGPQWACEPQLAGGVAAVGVEPIDPHNKDAQQERATKNAKDALKRQIHFKVKRILKNFSQLSGLGTDDFYKKITNSVSQSVSQKILSNATEMKLWSAPSNKDLYLLLAIDPETAHTVTKKEILDALKTNKKLWKEIDDEDGLEILLPEILKEMGQIPNL
jgi:hypothetical protein